MHFLHMAWLEFKGHKAAFNLEEYILLETLYPFLTLVFYCVMAGYAYGVSDLTEWVIGNAFLLCTNICVFSLGNSFVGERYSGRIRSVMVGETSKIEIVLQKGFFPGLVSFITTLTGFICGFWCFNISLRGIHWEMLLLVFGVAIFSATGFGMFLSALGLISDQMHMILNIINYILLIFSGANFPISQLPYVMQGVSKVMPLTRSISAARGVISGIKWDVLQKLIVMEAVVGVIYILLAVFMMKGAEKIAIKKGTLDLF